MSISNIVSNYIKPIRDWYSKINPATLTGAIDVIVVQQQDGTFLSSPFHVRFGKLGVLTATEKIVDIEVNEVPVAIHMKLDDNGAAYFVEPVESHQEEEDLPPELATSPIPFFFSPVDSLKKRYNSFSSNASSKSMISSRRIELITVNPELVMTQTAAVQADISGDDPNNFEFKILEVDPFESVSNEVPLFQEDSSSCKNEDIIFDMDEEPEIELSNSYNEKHRFDDEIMPCTSGSKLTNRASSPTRTEQSWEWGQLPGQNLAVNTLQVPSEHYGVPKSVQRDEEIKPQDAGWGLSYLWRGRSKSVGKKPDFPEGKLNHPGIYLDDLKDGDEEMLQLYVGRTRSVPPESRVPKDDDTESGNGPSLPMSLTDSGISRLDDAQRLFSHVDLSLCGGLEDLTKFSPFLFEQSRLSFDDFVHYLQRPDFKLFECPNLVIRIGEQYYKWSDACPIIMSTILFGRTLPKYFSDMTLTPIVSDARETDTLSVDPQRQNSDAGEAAVLSLDLQSQNSDAGEAAVLSLDPQSQNSNSPEKKMSTSWWPFGTSSHQAKNPVTVQSDARPALASPKVVTMYSVATQTGEMDPDACIIDPSENKQKFRKSLRLSNEAINLLKLKAGLNEIQFSVTTAYQGTTRCYCHLYLWKHTDKIVISDIDGTITKSDVLGHVMPIIGRDWAHAGVASLFTKIVNNGYHIAYLSARAIGQASLTKDYLSSVRQEGMLLPEGPLFLNPTSLMNAFHSEVIEKKPEVFKIACLMDIRSLFPDTHNPFYAGYGNRENDVRAYTAVGIPISRIFTINHRGELRHELNNTFQASYASQSQIVDHLFPSRVLPKSFGNGTPTSPAEFSNFAYWKEPLPNRIVPETGSIGGQSV